MFKKYWIFGINHSHVKQSETIITVVSLCVSEQHWKLLFSIGKYGIYKSVGIFDTYV